jgi:hypothetical protein
MRITRSDPRNLVIVDFPYVVGLIAFPAAALMMVYAGIGLYRHAGDTGSTAGAVSDCGNVAVGNEIIGPFIGALLFFFGGAVFAKRSEFNFDGDARLLTWRRRGLFTNTGGVLPFDQIRRALVQASDDTEGGMTYRVALSTTDAGTIPLTEMYVSGLPDKYDTVRDAINTVLGVAGTAAQQVETEILELALAGQKIDAVALARQRYGYDLAQAKRFVEALPK